jgi:hypothetical protein
MNSPSELLFAAILIGVGLWLVSRARYLVAAFTAHYPALNTPRAAGLLAITILAIGIGMAGFGCRMMVGP